jgi:hypothetical protein
MNPDSKPCMKRNQITTITISLPRSLLRQAQKRQRRLHYPTMSSYLRELLSVAVGWPPGTEAAEKPRTDERAHWFWDRPSSDASRPPPPRKQPAAVVVGRCRVRGVRSLAPLGEGQSPQWGIGCIPRQRWSNDRLGQRARVS